MRIATSMRPSLWHMAGLPISARKKCLTAYWRLILSAFLGAGQLVEISERSSGLNISGIGHWRALVTRIVDISSWREALTGRPDRRDIWRFSNCRLIDDGR